MSPHLPDGPGEKNQKTHLDHDTQMYIMPATPSTRMRAAIRIRVYGNTVHWIVTPAVWVRVTTFSCCRGIWMSDAMIDSFSATAVVMFRTESLFNIDL